jgi:hypothetical protein
VCNMKVCVLGSDWMLGEHILLFNSWSSRSPSCDQSLLPRLYSTFRRRETKRDQMCRNIVFFTNFVRFEKKSFPIFVCSKSGNSVITHPRSSPRRLFRIHLVLILVYYESIKRNPKIRGIKKCRCDERLQTKTKEFTLLPYTGLVLELEHLKIETRLISERFANVMGECEN